MSAHTHLYVHTIQVHGGEPQVGQTVTAYVQNVRTDGKVDVALRPVGFDKVLFARNKILEALKVSDGVIYCYEKAYIFSRLLGRDRTDIS